MTMLSGLICGLATGLLISGKYASNPQQVKVSLICIIVISLAQLAVSVIQTVKNTR